VQAPFLLGADHAAHQERRHVGVGVDQLQVAQEEDAILDEQGKMLWVLKRQTEFHLVR